MGDIGDKIAARNRIYDLVAEENQRKSLVNAYKLKSQVVGMTNKIQDNSPYFQIRTLDPIIVAPEKKFEHLRAALIAPLPFNGQRSTSPFKTNPTATNQIHSPLVAKLTSKETFPVAYLKKHSEEGIDEDGDILDLSKKTNKMLKGGTKLDSYVPTRAADFRSEIRWRLQLRNTT